MATFIKPGAGNILSKSIILAASPGIKLKLAAHNKYYASLAIDTSVEPQFLFDKEAEAIKDGSIKAGQRVSLNLGEASTGQYHVQLVPNPELARAGYVGGPQMLEPHETTSLHFVFKADKVLDISKLDYLFKLYIID